MGTERAIIDADYEVIGGPYRVGDEHRSEKDWFFTGRYDPQGNPYFIRGPKWWRRLKLKHALRRAWYIGFLTFGACALVFAILQQLGVFDAH